MSCLRFFTQNFAEADEYANLYASSEQGSFPSTNALGKVRRSKVWRSAGYYKIVSGENTITFRDSTVTDIVATITPGEYTTTAAFMTAVDTALEAVGAANYTVTQNSNYKFVITSDLSGGATAFQLRWASSTDMADIMGFEAVNLTGASTYTADYLRINNEEFFTFDLGIPSNVQALAITGGRNTVLKLSSGGTFKLQGNPTNEWSAPAYDYTLTYDDEVITVQNEDGLHTEALRYWRILFQDQNPNGYVEVGSIFLGLMYAPTRGRAKFPFTSQFEDRSIIVQSEGGQSLSEVRQQSQLFTVEWNGLTKTEIEDITEIFRNYGTAYPFFLEFDAEAAFSSSESRLLKYVKFQDEPKYSLDTPNNFSSTMMFREDL